MKKNIIFTVTALLSCIFISCSNNAMDKGTGYTDDEIFSSVKFVGQESAPVLFNNQQSLQGIPPNTDGVTIIKIIFGKKVKSVKSLGFVEL